MNFPRNYSETFPVANGHMTSIFQNEQIRHTCFGLLLANTAPVLEAGGKPSTRFPPEGLVMLTSHLQVHTFNSKTIIWMKKLNLNNRNL